MNYANEMERKTQIEEGARLNRSAANPRRGAHFSQRNPKAVTPKGHEAFLKALEVSGAQIRFEFLDGAEDVTGMIKHSDKYTISVKCSDGSTHVIFKHSLRKFVPLQPRPSETVGEGAVQ